MPLAEQLLPISVMLALVGASAFFSGSEAALFSLGRPERAAMAAGSGRDRRALALLARPDRLLTAILFWNLVVNLTYYALTEVVAVRIARADGAESWSSGAFRVLALATIIVFSEVLPKSLAVLRPRLLSGLAAGPLGFATRLVDPILPWLEAMSDACARLVLPSIAPEPYLELNDLENAVELRAGETLESEAQLFAEQQVLKRVVELADTTAADLMRPRRRCLVVRPPASLADLREKLEGVGEYVLVTEIESEELASSIPMERLAMLPPDRIDRHAEPLTFVPWCASAADTLNRLREEGRRVACVVNELGETIGIVPMERLLDAVLRDATREDPDDAHAARLAPIGDEAWEASGATPLRRVAKRLEEWLHERRPDAGSLAEELAAVRSRTVGGLLQEQLERPPQRGDQVELAGILWTVTAGSDAERDSEDLPVIVRLEAADPSRTESNADNGEAPVTSPTEEAP